MGFSPERFVLLHAKAYEATGVDATVPPGVVTKVSASQVTDDLVVGLTVLATGRVNGEPHEDAAEIALAYLKRAAPGIIWSASGVI